MPTRTAPASRFAVRRTGSYPASACLASAGLASAPAEQAGCSDRCYTDLSRLTSRGVAALGAGLFPPGPSPIDLACAGWSVIPVVAHGKKALVAWTALQATPPAPEEVESWSRRFPTANWAVVLGRCSGNLICVDVDGPAGHHWCDVHGGLWQPRGPWCSTERGWAYFFSIPNKLSGFTARRLHEQVELLGTGHCHNVPPSVSENGTSYRWQRRPVLTEPVPFAPQWVLRLIEGEPIAAPAPVREGVGSVVASIQYEILATPPARKAGRSPRVAALVALLEKPEVAIGFLQLCGREGVRIEKAFRCCLPGHIDTHPSAALYAPPGRPFVLHDFHAYSKDEEWFPLPDVLAAVRTGRVRKLSSGERAVWLLRGLAELGRVGLPALAVPELPDDTPKVARKLFDGFVLLLRLREVYEPGQAGDGAPFSWRFAGDWCGVRSQASVSRAMKWLLERRLLRIAVPGSCPARGGPRRAALIAIGKVNCAITNECSGQRNERGQFIRGNPVVDRLGNRPLAVCGGDQEPPGGPQCPVTAHSDEARRGGTR